MKKGFLSVLVLMSLLILSLTISFVYQQNKDTSTYTRDLFNRKKARYKAESVLNICYVDNFEEIEEIIIKDYEKMLANRKKYETKFYSVDTTIDSKKYTAKILHISRDEDDSLKDVYRINLNDVIVVGNSQANPEYFLKVIDDPEKPGVKTIKIISKQFY